MMMMTVSLFFFVVLRRFSLLLSLSLLRDTNEMKMRVCVCVYVRVGFQDKNEPNACFMYEKYLILSQREEKKRKAVQRRYALQTKRRREREK